MSDEWTLQRLEQMVADQIEESYLLDYKHSNALDKNKASEITKDVSAFANSAGGTLIYGVFESKEDRHLPGGLDDGSDPKVVSREWLEDVVKSIRPRLDGVRISPVPLGTGRYAYVVEIPQGSTAHQAKDLKYYKRLNFSCEPMADYEIRDTMRRSDYPRIDVKFGFEAFHRSADLHRYNLAIELENTGQRRASDFKLSFWFPVGIKIEDTTMSVPGSDIRIGKAPFLFRRYGFILKGKYVLFPQDTWRPADNSLTFAYQVDANTFHQIANHPEAAVHWQFWVDDALPQSGIVPFQNLNDF